VRALWLAGLLACLAAGVLAAGPLRRAKGEVPALWLPALFADHMVVQRERAVPVWGSAPPGSGIAAHLAGQERTTIAGPGGDWRLAFDPMPAGGPHELVVRGGGETRRFSDVLVGEVWLASGQSNMEMPLAGWGRVSDFESEIARAEYPEIRLFQVAHATAMQPQRDVATADSATGGWRTTTPESVANFSAVAYFFGRRLHRELGVPIGLAQSAWGGTVVEAWTSAETLEHSADFGAAAREVASTTPEGLAEIRREYEAAIAARRRAFATEDEGLAAGVPQWVGPEFDDSDWETLELPGKWEDAGYTDLDGSVWFRRELAIPEAWLGHDLTLNLGFVEDDDETYFNGTRIGGTTGWQTRRYRVPAETVRAGRNVLAVRVLDLAQYGGIWGEVSEFALQGPGGEKLPLAGPWRFRVGLAFEPLPLDPGEPNRATVLYNGMIAPLEPYALRGVIWYQGESNADRAYQYRALFRGLIRDWRAHWGQGDFPFYFVQLAAFLPVEPEPGESGWAELREAQAMALVEPATGMAVAVDIGNAADVHPKDKQDVGNRLARLALARTYGRDVADSGPVYRGMAHEGSSIRLTFDHLDGGLEAKGGALRGFAIAGEDRVFRWAAARIERGSVVVWNDAVTAPVAVRYGWAANPLCNLTNSAGLPASPFRTDDWPGVSAPVD
jgi:sialate O-acetylesterase